MKTLYSILIFIAGLIVSILFSDTKGYCKECIENHQISGTLPPRDVKVKKSCGCGSRY